MLAPIISKHENKKLTGQSYWMIQITMTKNSRIYWHENYMEISKNDRSFKQKVFKT